MRIVGGTLSGRRFSGPGGERTRPTAERVREAIASAIESRGGFAGTRVLDLFAGTGAMAFEAVSRGAAHAWLVDRDPRATRAIAQAARALGIAERCTVVRADLGSPAALARVADGAPFDRVFVDPPYAEAAEVGPLLEALRSGGLLRQGCLLAVEHGRGRAPEIPSGFEVLSRPRYGDAAVLLLRAGA